MERCHNRMDLKKKHVKAYFEEQNSDNFAWNCEPNVN